MFVESDDITHNQVAKFTMPLHWAYRDEKMNAPETEYFKSVPSDHPLRGLVAPLFAGHNNVRERMEGTAFLIAPQLAFTAKHVIVDYLQNIQNYSIEKKIEAGGHHNGTMSFAMFLPVLTKDGCNIPLVVENTYFCGFGDIALLRVRLANNNHDWKDLAPYPSLKLMPPSEGSIISSLGFPNSSTKRNKQNVVELHTWPRISYGSVQEVHHQKRDSHLLNYPCFQVNARLDGGMSGGPVLDDAGQICGLVSKSYDLMPGEEPIGYAASLWPSGMIPMPDLPPISNDTVRLIDLYKRERVAVNDLYNVRAGFDSNGKFVIHPNPGA